MNIHFFFGCAGMYCQSLKTSRLSALLFPGVLVSLTVASLILGLSASVNAQPDNQADVQEPDQAQELETKEAPAESPTPRSNRGVIQLESQVTGNREQPQVFYLVPWQSPESPQLPYDPLGSQLEQVFGHLEREELRRELKQREQLQADEGSGPIENQ